MPFSLCVCTHVCMHMYTHALCNSFQVSIPTSSAFLLLKFDLMKMYNAEGIFEQIVPISALKGKNVDTLVKLMVEKMPEGPQYYPEDMITDVNERFIVAEIVREKTLKNLRDEIPHGIAVDIIQMKQKENGTYHIEVDLICEKDSHKGIIIGKNGASLKKIGETARYEIERFLKAKVNLKIWVKVRKEWRDNGLLLKELGYKKTK